MLEHGFFNSSFINWYYKCILLILYLPFTGIIVLKKVLTVVLVYLRVQKLPSRFKYRKAEGNNCVGIG